MTAVSPLLQSEHLVGLAELAKRIRSPRRDGHLSPQAVWRWAVKGVRLPDGRVARLETLRLAGRFVSSFEALQRFVAAQNDLPQPAEAPVKPRTRLQTRREAERIEQHLDAAGF